MLTFVGLGLYDERSITIEGREALAAANRVFAEFYTSRLAGVSMPDLEAYHDVSITVRDRAGTERDPEPVLDAADGNETVFLVAGDPMISTTHVDLRLRAVERDIDTRVVHGTTAQTAASSLSGLQNYRFGKATTLPFAYGSVGVPDSVLETIADNRERGLHTLCYLDIEAASDRYMSASQAADRLADEVVTHEAFPDGDGTIAVAIARAGSPNPLVRADRLAALRMVDLGDPLHLLVLPGDLHHLEARALETLGGGPSDVLSTADR
jgi:diphthine synthase